MKSTNGVILWQNFDASEITTLAVVPGNGAGDACDCKDKLCTQGVDINQNLICRPRDPACPIGDMDNDGVLDNVDNCPTVANPNQENTSPILPKLVIAGTENDKENPFAISKYDITTDSYTNLSSTFNDFNTSANLNRDRIGDYDIGTDGNVYMIGIDTAKKIG